MIASEPIHDMHGQQIYEHDLVRVKHYQTKRGPDLPPSIVDLPPSIVDLPPSIATVHGWWRVVLDGKEFTPTAK